MLCKIQPVYWFFIPLFMWYLSLPLFSFLHGRRRLCEYLISVALIVESLLPFLCQYFADRLKIQFYGLSGFMVLMLLGYYLAHYEVRRLRLIYTMGFLCFLVHCVGTTVCSGESVNRFLKGYTAPLCIMYSTAVFLLIKNFPIHRKIGAVEFLVRLIKSESLGIYLMHCFLLVAACRIGLDNSSISYRLIAPLVICIVCAYISRFLRLIKLGWMV